MSHVYIVSGVYKEWCLSQSISGVFAGGSTPLVSAVFLVSLYNISQHIVFLVSTFFNVLFSLCHWQYLSTAYNVSVPISPSRSAVFLHGFCSTTHILSVFGIFMESTVSLLSYVSQHLYMAVTVAMNYSINIFSIAVHS